MKKHWNRLISLTLALAMAVVCLAGCGGAASSEAAEFLGERFRSCGALRPC